MKKKILILIAICLFGFLGFIASEVEHEIKRIEQERAIYHVNHTTDSSEISQDEIELAAKEYAELYGDTPKNMTKEEREYAERYTASIQKDICKKKK